MDLSERIHGYLTNISLQDLVDRRPERTHAGDAADRSDGRRQRPKVELDHSPRQPVAGLGS
jgi:hypothetical protein